MSTTDSNGTTSADATVNGATPPAETPDYVTTTPVENSSTPVDATAPASTDSKIEEPKGSFEATVTINSGAVIRSLSNVMFAGIGAGGIVAIFMALSYIGKMVNAIMPFVWGGFLFATLVSTFYLLLRVRKNMRASNKLRITFTEGYTAVAVFLAMGFFATACMHAFMGDGLTLVHWTYGVVTAGVAVVGQGFGKFFVSLYAEGAKKR